MRREDGFTLLEVLVAVALIALMAVPATETLRKGIDSWQKSHARVDESEYRLLTRRRLADWMRTAYPADPLRRGGVLEYPFEGSEDSVEFIGAINPNEWSDELYKVLLSVKEGVLVATIRSDYRPDAPVMVETPLIEGVTAASFSYLNSDIGQPANWVSEWQGQLSPPRAVRLSLDLDDDSIFWPDLIMPLEVQQWAHCAYDPVALACRSGGGG